MVLGCPDCAVQLTKFEGETSEDGFRKPGADFGVNHDWVFCGRHGVACIEQYCVPMFLALVWACLWVWGRTLIRARGGGSRAMALVGSFEYGTAIGRCGWHFGDAMRWVPVPAALMLIAAG